MESPSFVQTLKGKNWRFESATSLEDVLCLAVIKAHGEPLFDVKDVYEAREQWLELFNGDCLECPYHETCMACLINE